MSTPSPKPDKKNWRTRSKAQRPIRHRWQMRGDVRDSRFRQRSWRQSVMLWGVLGGILVTLGLFAFLVLQAPRKTPLLTLVARDYAWPYRPNSWAQEDLDRFDSLNGRSLEVVHKLSNSDVHSSRSPPPRQASSDRTG